MLERREYRVVGVWPYQDVNGNGKLDMNLLSLTAEPYGFSSPWRRLPDFDRFAFDIGDGPRTVTVELGPPPAPK